MICCIPLWFLSLVRTTPSYGPKMAIFSPKPPSPQDYLPPDFLKPPGQQPPMVTFRQYMSIPSSSSPPLPHIPRKFQDALHLSPASRVPLPIVSVRLQNNSNGHETFRFPFSPVPAGRFHSIPYLEREGWFFHADVAYTEKTSVVTFTVGEKSRNSHLEVVSDPRLQKKGVISLVPGICSRSKIHYSRRI